MEKLYIAPANRSPEVDFDFFANVFALRGESYPEDVSEFYGPIINRLKSHLESLRDAKITVDFDMVYFNSSTAKVLMGLFVALDKTAIRNNDVQINWHYREDDDGMQEIGEEFGEDLEHVRFVMTPVAVG
ncbi:MAG: DUF1987 domain-containing protein [Sulfuricella sp.]|nr:DUF1987 domain-containing protein [Sulfuricella sp.]